MAQWHCKDVLYVLMYTLPEMIFQCRSIALQVWQWSDDENLSKRDFQTAFGCLELSDVHTDDFDIDSCLLTKSVQHDEYL